jgi:hypothetical protein
VKNDKLSFKSGEGSRKWSAEEAATRAVSVENLKQAHDA